MARGGTERAVRAVRVRAGPGSAGGGADPAGVLRRRACGQTRLKHHRPSASEATATEAATVADLPGAAPS